METFLDQYAFEKKNVNTNEETNFDLENISFSKPKRKQNQRIMIFHETIVYYKFFSIEKKVHFTSSYG